MSARPNVKDMNDGNMKSKTHSGISANSDIAFVIFGFFDEFEWKQNELNFDFSNDLFFHNLKVKR